MSTICKPTPCVADFWKVFYFENSRFARDTLRVANRSPTPTSKTIGPFDVIWGVRGRRSRLILGVLGVWAGIKNIGGWESESFMDLPYREVVFRVRVVRDVRAKLCASPPWFLAF